MIVHIKEIVRRAVQGRYAIGAFNTANLETTIGIVRAARRTRRPVIIQISDKTIAYAGLEAIVEIIETVAEKEAPQTPIAIHLDHGHDLKTIKACLAAGLSSVHMDASDKPLAENIALTKKAAVLAHRRGAWTQGELGSLFGHEGMTKVKLPRNADDYLTDPLKVKEFVKRTGVDTLAVAVGTMHGSFKGWEKINFRRLTEIARQVKTPLVLHGASGVPAGQIKKAIKHGIRIVNIDTELRIAFTRALRLTLKTMGSTYDPRKALAPSIEAVAKAVAKEIKNFSM